MSTKSKRRSARRAGQENTNPTGQTQAPPEEQRQAIGAVMGALLGAITFGVVEEAPRSHRQL